jgi:hypothetical protein
MMILSDIIADPDNCLCVPCIACHDLQPLWVTDYSDHVRSGMLVYCGEKCAYQVFAERKDGVGIYHSFAVLRLSPEQVAGEIRWHDQLRKRVGEGRDWDWWIGEFRQRALPDYSACEVIGWFER